MQPGKMIKRIRAILFQISFFVLLLLSFSLLWILKTYGNIGLEEIVFHLNMPLKGVYQNFVNSYIRSALCPAVLGCAIEWIAFCFPVKYSCCCIIKAKSKKIKFSLYPLRIPTIIISFLCLVWLIILFCIADKNFEAVSYLKNQMLQSELIKNEYISPKDTEITFPAQKRNLIWIYMESAESSSQDKRNGGFFDVNVIPELTQLANDNVSFSQSDLIEGAAVAPACGWTIAGLVAETSGLPLKLFAYDDSSTDNSMNKYASFMPGAISLGDILETQGYRNYFMAGSDFEFGGRLNYFIQHGNYEIFDYYSAIEEGKISADYHVWWGFEDAKLYSYAKEKLLELAQEEEPFNFSLLTVDTHHQDGYLCELCPDTYNDRYSNVWACASSQVDEFVKWIQQQDFYKNTTIVISGDHCSMDTDFYGDLAYDKHHGATKRKVYNAIINPAVQPIQQKNRKFTTLDLFPTVLASMGATMEGNRLGLGTNLFSEEQTLSEKYGYDKLFEELNKKSAFYDKNILYPSRRSGETPLE